MPPKKDGISTIIFTGTQDEGRVYEAQRVENPQRCQFHRIQDQRKSNPACQWVAEANAYKCFLVPRVHRDGIHVHKGKCS